MNRLRRTPDSVPSVSNCCRCAREGCWDRIAGKSYCPACQEALAQGEAEPLIERTTHDRCAVCDYLGTVAYQTFPLNAASAVEIDLCPEHLRFLLSRRLGPHAYHQLRRQLQEMNVTIEEIFLLHEAFYDSMGRAKQPACEV